ncbi:MAG: hypothetical protein HZB55_16440 [Deltaproteobacteria bacterium]|nr:hypothetical protein [Deltaproteobacteria bacterium]
MKNPLGGLAKKSYLVRELQRKGQAVVLLDGGNLLFGKTLLKDLERPQLTLKASKIVEAYNAMGLDAAGVGPMDFADGLESLLRLLKDAQFPVVCSNLVWKDTGSPVFRPQILVQRGGLSIGLVGALDPAVKIEGLGRDAAKVRVQPIYQSVRKAARLLRGEGADVVVLLSAIDPKKIRVLATNGGDVDLFLGGDPKDKLMIPYRVKNALVAGSSQLGKYVGHVELSRGADGSLDLKHAFVPMKLNRPEEPKVKRIVDSYYRAVAKFRTEGSRMYVKENEEAVNLAHDKPVYASAEECKACHRAQYDRWRASRHARAYAALPDAARRQMECVECHVTGFGKWGGFDGVTKAPDLTGVQCEECHGPGSSHPATASVRAGEAARSVCRKCHTRSRSPDFNAREYLSRLGCGGAAR